MIARFLSVVFLNYISLLLVQPSDAWLTQTTGAAFVDISAGIAFVTILLLGVAGAFATWVALMLQYYQFDGGSWLTFTAYALSSVSLQLAVIYVGLRLFGVGRALNGLTHLQLLTLSAVFSVAYTTTDAFVLQHLHPFSTKTLSQHAIGDFFGIIACFVCIKLVVSVHRRLIRLWT
jgi:hypothetical protein